MHSPANPLSCLQRKSAVKNCDTLLSLTTVKSERTLSATTPTGLSPGAPFSIAEQFWEREKGISKPAVELVVRRRSPMMCIIVATYTLSQDVSHLTFPA